MSSVLTYAEAVAFIESIPKFSSAPSEEGTQLLQITRLLDLVGNPHRQLKFVHIAGTNGKGSTAAFMQQILTESGLTCGLYTSPALERFTERIRIGDAEIGEEELTELTGIVRAAYEQMKQDGKVLPTEYEIVFTIAVLYFARQQCDIVVLEVGMGGAYDATNVIDVPELAMITSISQDHTAILGNTPAAIAEAKAGIIKTGGTVLLYPQKPEVTAVVKRVCEEKQARLVSAVMPEGVKSSSLAGQTFDLEERKDLRISLLGNYQICNAAMAVNGALLLREKGWQISDEAIEMGLLHTCWPGRFELMYTCPAVIVDGGHNAQGAEVLKASLQQYFGEKKICFVTGVLADKEYDAMMGGLQSLAKSFYTITPDNPRALSAEALAEYLRENGAAAYACSNVKEALHAAMQEAGRDGVVCVFGSLYYLGEVRKYLSLQKRRILTLGANVRTARLQAGLSEAALADLTGITVQQLMDLEKGEGDPEFACLWDIAAACGIEAAQLLEETDSWREGKTND